VTEISTYKHPQPVFIACLKVLCLLLGCPPDEQHLSKYDPEGIFYAAKKKLFSDSFQLLKTLSGFDRSTLSSDKLELIKLIVEQEDLTVERVERVSLAMANLAHWLLALI